MIISLKSPVVPEYRAVVTLKPIEEPMKITHYKKNKNPLITNKVLLLVAVYWAITNLAFLLTR